MVITKLPFDEHGLLFDEHNLLMKGEKMKALAANDRS
jgi:hypothetical protein